MRRLCEGLCCIYFALQTIASCVQPLSLKTIGLGRRERRLLLFAEISSLCLSVGGLRVSLFCFFQPCLGGFKASQTLGGIHQNLLVAVQLVDLARDVFDLMIAGAEIEQRRIRCRKSLACFSCSDFSVGVRINRFAVAPLGIGNAGVEVRYAPRQIGLGSAGSHHLESLALCLELLECSRRSLDFDKALSPSRSWRPSHP